MIQALIGGKTNNSGHLPIVVLISILEKLIVWPWCARHRKAYLVSFVKASTHA